MLKKQTPAQLKKTKLMYKRETVAQLTAPQLADVVGGSNFSFPFECGSSGGTQTSH